LDLTHGNLADVTADWRFESKADISQVAIANASVHRHIQSHVFLSRLCPASLRCRRDCRWSVARQIETDVMGVPRRSWRSNLRLLHPH
jgi:hypothetical protein